MKRAEDLANARWPIHSWSVLPQEGEHGEILNFDDWLDDYRIFIQSYSANHGFQQGYEQALADIEKFAESLTANAHEMPNENPKKAEYEGWDSALQQVFDYINHLKD